MQLEEQNAADAWGGDAILEVVESSRVVGNRATSFGDHSAVVREGCIILIVSIDMNTYTLSSSVLVSWTCAWTCAWTLSICCDLRSSHLEILLCLVAVEQRRYY